MRLLEIATLFLIKFWHGKHWDHMTDQLFPLSEHTPSFGSSYKLYFFYSALIKVAYTAILCFVQFFKCASN